MAEIKPEKLVLRCYGYKSKNAPFVGICIDLNLAVQADSPDELRKKMSEAIIGYIETVLDTDDKASIPQLIARKAPLRDILIYNLIKCIDYIRQFPGNFTFKEYIPFHLAHNC